MQTPPDGSTTVDRSNHRPGGAGIQQSGGLRITHDRSFVDTIDLRRPEQNTIDLDPAPPISLPRVTVLVPTLNEEQQLPDLLDDLAGQSLRPHQVIVIDGGSTDGTRSVVDQRNDLPIQVLDNPAKRVPQALNIGLAASTGDVIVRIDGHARVNRSYLQTIARHFHADPTLGGVGGTKRAVATTPTGRTIAKVLSSPFGVGGSRYHYASEVESVDHIPFGAYRRAVLEELGGWDEMFAVNQDYELDFRVRQTGRMLLLDPAARIDWHSRETIARLAHQYYRYGQGKALVIWTHPTSAKPRHLLPAVIVLGLGASGLTAAAMARPWPLVLVPAYGALCAALGAAVDGVGRREWPTATAAVASMQLSYGAGLVRGFGRRLLGRTPNISSSQTGSLSRPSA